MEKILQNYQTLKDELDPQSIDAESQGKTIIQVGSATCEKAAGADDVRAEFEKLIKASGRDDIIIKQTGCTGRCAKEPIVGVFVPNKIPAKYGKVAVEEVPQIFHEHVINGNPIAEFMLDKKTDILYKNVVSICSAHNAQGHDVSWAEIFEKKITELNLPKDLIKVMHGGCIGLCEKGGHAVMMVYPDNKIYKFSTIEEMEEILKTHFVDGKTIDKFLIHADQITEDYIKLYGDVSFYSKQTRITLSNCGIIDPESLQDYIHQQGYAALAKVLQKGDPDWVIDEILESGLRGRGGGGFPTGIKWKNTKVLNQDDPIRYIICNADEGDPGAFMDRSALEGDPFSIIEGMTIAGYAIGAQKGFLYVRAEYPLAIKRLELAIEKARNRNLLGDNILGSDYSFDLEIRLGAGAFVCGEETALIHSIEGRRGQPRMRPPYPSEKGLWGHPTCINNVETWANVPHIILYGAKWYSSIGTEDSKGTKVFALAGKVENTGLVEVPMGTTLREIIFDIGGGIPDGHKLKAVQTGGPSGGCIPYDKIDTPVDYKSLAEINSIMGSGGMIVLDETDCMVQTAKYFMEFCVDESCGKCLPCREGTFRMLEILNRITDGKGEMEDLDKLERLGHLIKKSSLCGLGQTAPNPVLNALANFREEFEIHIKEKRCPTQKCPKLITYTIDEEKCTGCQVCARRCPVSCIRGFRKKPHDIMQDLCIKCGECYNSCKFDAIIKI